MGNRHSQPKKLLKMTSPWSQSVSVLRCSLRKDDKGESGKALKVRRTSCRNPSCGDVQADDAICDSSLFSLLIRFCLNILCLPQRIVILHLPLSAQLLSFFSTSSSHPTLTHTVHLPAQHTPPSSLLIISVQIPALQRCSLRHTYEDFVSQIFKSLQVGLNSISQIASCRNQQVFFHTGPFRVITNHTFIADETFSDPVLNRQHLSAFKNVHHCATTFFIHERSYYVQEAPLFLRNLSTDWTGVVLSRTAFLPMPTPKELISLAIGMSS